MKRLIPAAVCLFWSAGIVAHEGHDHQQKAHQKTASVLILNEQNWDQAVPHGKEVDAIYGDAVLSNAYLTAVIANPIATRHANMTVRNVGGCLIDLSTNHASSDQLSCYYPLQRKYSFNGLKLDQSRSESVVDGKTRDHSTVQVSTSAVDEKNGVHVTQKYRLEDGQRYLTVITEFQNKGDKPATITLEDDLRADGGSKNIVSRGTGVSHFYWFADQYWGQAYAIVPQKAWQVKATSGDRTHQLQYQYAAHEKAQLQLTAGQSFQFERRIYPGHNLIEIQSNHARDLGKTLKTVEITVKDASARLVANALVHLKNGSDFQASGRTDTHGLLKTELPEGEYQLTAEVLGVKLAEQSPVKLVVKSAGSSPQAFDFDLPQSNFGTAAAKITDEAGKPIACKVEFIPKNGGPLPYFGPDTAEFGVMNLRYAPHGEFTQDLAAGEYKVIVSHGPEYDAIFTEVAIQPGKQAQLTGKLVRSVKTPGWVSTDYHSHSSPSGDNISSQLGRVLNLVCEHIEFAPCTEHNRIETYEPEIAELKIGHAISTVSGMEMTGTPLPLNHQNVFPLKYTPRIQDGGGPTADLDPTVQIQRIFNWDNLSDKLIQQNHPDIGWLFYDKNGDQKPDGGYKGSLGLIDVMEIHPIDMITQLKPTAQENDREATNQMFAWLQLLNQGYRIPGVVNTDAHYNFHGSGGLRNWVQSSTDDPAKVNVMEMVHNSEQGRVIISNGPYMEVSMREAGQKKSVVAGQDLVAPSRKVTVSVRVQCPNWTDVNRVFVLVNGRIHKSHEYNTKSNPEKFKSGVVKFESDLELALEGDAHIIVVAAGEGLKLGPVMGPEWGAQQPTVVSNPVFVDIDANGFKPNKDTLDYPLPVKFVPKK